MPSTLFTPLALGDLVLDNRVVMAPMTRARVPSRVPNASTLTYYGQRAGAGLIVTEATTVSAQGDGSIATPGIYSSAQIDGWRRVTDAVHARGGLIACQLWHTGRVSHTSFQPEGGAPVSASAVAGQVVTYTERGFEPTTPPRALALDEIAGVVGQFAQAASNAIAAGFDAVEVHGGSGYLLDQFLRDGTNRREDAYGGSIPNRCRFVLEVVEAVAAAVGAGRTGLRISPMLVTWDCRDSDPVPLFTHLLRELAPRGLAYLHMLERNVASIAVSAEGAADEARNEEGVRAIREAWTGPYIANGCYDRVSAGAAIAAGHASAVSFGRDYIATPDLAERLRVGAPLNPPADPVVYYGSGGDAGYIDFPASAYGD